MSKRFFMLVALAALIFPACDDSSDPTEECGNAQIEGEEECDDGNQIDDDECSNACKLNSSEPEAPKCGNGKKEADEECDDGNQIDDDECSNACKLNSSEPEAPKCGNGKKEADEECDDGNQIDDDDCSNACKLNSSEPEAPKCGNGKIEADEECDDGNQIDDDKCSNACKLNSSEPEAPKCGNGKKEANEECDDGNQIDDDDCSNACKINVPETPWYSPNPGAATKCGDKRLEAGEICERNQEPPEEGWECINKDGVCVWKTPTPVCGNGIKETGEECDDGNTIAADGCSKKCQLEDEDVCQMRNGSKAKVLLVQDGDTLKIRLFNDGKCKYDANSALTIRIHGLDCPECLKSKTESPIDKTYNNAQACDIQKKAPCTQSNLYDYKTLEECRNHNERGGYEAAEFVNNLIYSEENNAEIEIACETVSSTDATCLLDNTRTRYLAYVGVKSNNATVDLGKALIAAGLGLPFTAFTAQRTEEYCAAEKEAIDNKNGFWANGNTVEEAAKASFGSEKLGWRLDSAHCK